MLWSIFLDWLTEKSGWKGNFVLVCLVWVGRRYIFLGGYEELSPGYYIHFLPLADLNSIGGPRPTILTPSSANHDVGE